MLRVLRLSRSAWKWRSRYKAAQQSIFNAPRQSVFKAPQQPSKIQPQATPEQTKASSPQSTHNGPSDAETAKLIGCLLVIVSGTIGLIFLDSKKRSANEKAQAENKRIEDEPVRFELVARGIVKDDRGNVYEAVEPEFGPGLGMRVITPVRRSDE